MKEREYETEGVHFSPLALPLSLTLFALCMLSIGFLVRGQGAGI